MSDILLILTQCLAFLSDVYLFGKGSRAIFCSKAEPFFDASGLLPMNTSLPLVYFECEKGDLPLPYPFRLRWERQNAGYFSIGTKRRDEGHSIFHYCLSGRGHVRYRNQLYTVRPGSGFLGCIDEIDYFYPDDGTEDWFFFWFGFRGGNYRELSHWLIDQYGPVFQLHPNDDFVLKMQLLSSHGSLMYLNACDAASMVLDLLGTLKRQMEKQSLLSMPAPVQKAIQLVQESESMLRISEIADRLRISREHLSRLFQKTMNMSLQAYLEKQCCQLAKKLLLSTELPIERIAELCGYQSASSFIRMFQKKNNLSPQKFRFSASRLYSSGLPLS